MSSPRIAAVIPARMASSRFPGKPLIEIQGLPMVEHVRRRTLLCKRFCEVMVATCDPEIASVIERYGGKVVMTSPQHPAATDRVAEAAQALDCTHVVNVQGDEILVMPEDLGKMVQAMESQPQIDAWNAVAPLEETSQLGDPSIVKCAVSASRRILFCLRDSSGFSAGGREGFHPFYQILGISGYRREFLSQYGSLARTPLEEAHSIDQMRIIEHDVPLHAVFFRKGYLGINEEREVRIVQDLLQTDSLQKAVLKTLLVQ